MSVRDMERARLAMAIGQLGTGDSVAMRLVYDRTSAKLFAVCLRVLKDPALAEEVLQDVYLKVWHHADRFDSVRASPITWLCSIARNTAIDRLRSAQRQPVADGELPDIVPDESPLADVVIEQRQEQDRMLACIAKLDGGHAICIRAAFFDGYSYGELADRHRVPIGTMKSWIRRSLLRLRECLDDA
ncbi:MULTISPECIES: sigma-70 family RNA polymerase sigma factor [unclassified Sphingomonas]|uniref:sigma-70 family RNA polymerase sigma factor n=1 Tax=unclassified Sphingomonas TaxID=196159 RepID=UPI001E56967A|nr:MULTISPECIES: sigma-70 family RNA polymerase sigma factor [unclassified Sphingomonas]